MTFSRSGYHTIPSFAVRPFIKITLSLDRKLSFWELKYMLKKTRE